MVDLLIIGGLLCGFGAIFTIAALPLTGWNTSREETKEALRRMVHNRRFQVSVSCLIIGFCMLAYWFSIVSAAF